MRGFVRLSIVLAAAVSFAATEMTMNVDQLIDFIKSSVKMKLDDRKVAEYLHKVKLTNRLEDKIVETLQGQGAGPKTIAALHDLEESSASLAAAVPVAPKVVYVAPPPPNSIEQAKVWAETTEHMLNYTAGLPDYICSQVTRRYAAQEGRDNWRLLDTLMENLTYFDHKEDYKVVLINNQPVTNISHDQLGGAKSSGEYGTLPHDIFSPETDTEHDWERWATLRGKRMYVYNYRVRTSRSHFHIYDDPSRQTIIAGFRGLIYVDKESGRVMRILLECEDIPKDFPIQDVKLIVDYDWQDISGQSFVLPLREELTSRQRTANYGNYLVKNDIEWRLYRKYGAASTITFDTPEPLPDDKTKETPVGAEEQPKKPVTPVKPNGNPNN